MFFPYHRWRILPRRCCEATNRNEDMEEREISLAKTNSNSQGATPTSTSLPTVSSSPSATQAPIYTTSLSQTADKGAVRRSITFVTKSLTSISGLSAIPPSTTTSTPPFTFATVTFPTITFSTVTYPTITFPTVTFSTITYPTVTHPTITYPASIPPALTNTPTISPTATQVIGTYLISFLSSYSAGSMIPMSSASASLSSAQITAGRSVLSLTLQTTSSLSPTCNADNELRALSRFSGSATTFCPTFLLAPTGTLPDYVSVFPTPNVESACACFLGTTRKLPRQKLGRKACCAGQKWRPNSHSGEGFPRVL